MSTFSGPSYSEKEADTSLFVTSYLCPEVTLVPVADSIIGLDAPCLVVTSFVSHLAKFCVLGKRSTVSMLILGCFVNSQNSSLH